MIFVRYIRSDVPRFRFFSGSLALSVLGFGSSSERLLWMIAQNAVNKTLTHQLWIVKLRGTKCGFIIAKAQSHKQINLRRGRMNAKRNRDSSITSRDFLTGKRNQSGCLIRPSQRTKKFWSLAELRKNCFNVYLGRHANYMRRETVKSEENRAC